MSQSDTSRKSAPSAVPKVMFSANNFFIFCPILSYFVNLFIAFSGLAWGMERGKLQNLQIPSNIIQTSLDLSISTELNYYRWNTNHLFNIQKICVLYENLDAKIYKKNYI